MSISYFMVILDNSIIFTGPPRIEATTHFSPARLTRVQDAYTLVFGGLLLLVARAGDIAGRRRTFTAGLVLFGLAFLLFGAAPAVWWLVAARAVRGVGAAILAPSSLALLTATFPRDASGPGRSPPHSVVANIGASLDLAGALCATLGMTALVFAIVNSASRGRGSPLTVGALLAGVVLLAGLVFNEARAEHPVMPLRLFASRQRAGAYLVRMLYLGADVRCQPRGRPSHGADRRQAGARFRTDDLRRPGQHLPPGRQRPRPRRPHRDRHPDRPVATGTAHGRNGHRRVSASS